MTSKWLWLGSRKPKRVYIYIHGLSGSIFGSRQAVFQKLTSKKDAALIFNNRGSHIISGFQFGESGYRLGGAAFEKFTDCIDDIDGAISYAKKYKPKEIILVGHSTGCQKSIYWAHKKKQHGLVKKMILLAPMSDYAGTKERLGHKVYNALLKEAKMLVKKGMPNKLLSNTETEIGILSAQRFISLYTPDSIEEIFSYGSPKRTPRILRSIKIPLHIVFAEKDKWMDRPLEEILEWFEKHTNNQTMFSVIKGAGHSFKGAHNVLISHILKFLE